MKEWVKHKARANHRPTDRFPHFDVHAIFTRCLTSPSLTTTAHFPVHLEQSRLFVRSSTTIILTLYYCILTFFVLKVNGVKASASAPTTVFARKYITLSIFQCKHSWSPTTSTVQNSIVLVVQYVDRERRRYTCDVDRGIHMEMHTHSGNNNVLLYNGPSDGGLVKRFQTKISFKNLHKNIHMAYC